MSLTLAALPARAEDDTVERVVAMVEDTPILLSQVQRRAAPYVRQGAPQRDIYNQLVSKLIDERLLSDHAEAQSIRVTTDEIDKALESVAETQDQSVAELLEAVAEATGLSEADYRGELRRTILQYRVLSYEIADLSPDPAVAARQLAEAEQKLMKRLHAEHYVRVHVRFE